FLNRGMARRWPGTLLSKRRHERRTYDGRGRVHGAEPPGRDTSVFIPGCKCRFCQEYQPRRPAVRRRHTEELAEGDLVRADKCQALAFIVRQAWPRRSCSPLARLEVGVGLSLLNPNVGTRRMSWRYPWDICRSCRHAKWP